MSQGEDCARNHLISVKLSFIHDTANFFPKHARLRPDFVLRDLKTIIEIDGLDHFPQLPGARGKKSARENDTYKDQWCLENGWHMVRIPYLSTSAVKTIPGLIDSALAGIREKPKWFFTPIGTDYYERPHPCPRPLPNPSTRVGPASPSGPNPTDPDPTSFSNPNCRSHHESSFTL